MSLNQITLNAERALASNALALGRLFNARKIARYRKNGPQLVRKTGLIRVQAGFLKWLRRRVVGSAVLVALVMGMGMCAAATAEPDGRIEVELNRIRTVGDACRMSFVFVNKLAEPVETLSLEAVLFDTSGQVDRFFVLKSRPLPPRKMSVQEFDIAGAKCDTFGRLLLNDVRECGIGGEMMAECLEKLAPSSRAGLPFVTSIQ